VSIVCAIAVARSTSTASSIARAEDADHWRRGVRDHVRWDV